MKIPLVALLSALAWGGETAPLIPAELSADIAFQEADALAAESAVKDAQMRAQAARAVVDASKAKATAICGENFSWNREVVDGRAASRIVCGPKPEKDAPSAPK